MVYLSSDPLGSISIQVIIVNERSDGSSRVDNLAQTLGAQGWAVAVYRDTKEGVKHFRQALPNLVLLYAERPTKECFDLCRRLKNLGASSYTPVVLCSPAHKSVYKTRAYSSGVTDYWSELSESEEVLHRTRTYLQLQQAQREVVRLQAEMAISDEQAAVAAGNNLATATPPALDNLQTPANVDLNEVIAVLDEVVLTISGVTQDILLVSPSAEKLFGFSAAEFLEQKKLWKQTIHPEDLPKVNLTLQTLVVNQKSEIEYRIFNKSGGMRWVRASFYGIDQNNKITRIHGLIVDVTKQKQAEEQLMRQALFDDLTDIPNRTLFTQQLEKALSQTVRSPDYQFAVLFVDLSRFKQINDTFGHLIGDKLLISVAKILESCIRPVDMVSRFGGDEFTLFLDDIKDAVWAVQVAERILQALATPVHIDSCRLYISASIGIAIGNRSYRQVDDLLRDADTAMYRAKSKGKGNYDFFFDIQKHNLLQASSEKIVRRKKIRFTGLERSQKPSKALA